MDTLCKFIGESEVIPKKDLLRFLESYRHTTADSSPEFVRKDEVIAFLEQLLTDTDKQRGPIEETLDGTFASFEGGFRYGTYRGSREMIRKFQKYVREHTPKEDLDDFDEREGAFRMPT